MVQTAKRHGCEESQENTGRKPNVMAETNKRWLLAAHPESMPGPEHWRADTTPRPIPGPGQVLGRAIYLSVDPYMRGRIAKSQGYAAGVTIGGVMQGGAVAEVLESRHADWKPGDLFETMAFGWQEYAALDAAAAGPAGLRRIDPGIGPIHAFLSYLGMPGIAAYWALEDVGRPQAGETVVISAAAGAVGQVAGQICRIRGARPVALAGSAEKIAWCRELGYQEGIDYRARADDLTAALAEVCPDGVHVFLDNTAGPIHDAVMHNLAPGGRVILCGSIALAGRFDAPDLGERFLRRMLVLRARMQGFLVFDYMDRWDMARGELARWHQEGRLRFRTDMLHGIDTMPQAFINLLTSRNFGKQTVQVGEDPTQA